MLIGQPDQPSGQSQQQPSSSGQSAQQPPQAESASSTSAQSARQSGQTTPQPGQTTPQFGQTIAQSGQISQQQPSSAPSSGVSSIYPNISTAPPAINTSNAQNVPMDVETPAANVASTAETVSSVRPPDAGWTFVANTPTSSASSGSVTETNPSAPPVFYHSGNRRYISVRDRYNYKRFILDPKVADGLLQLHEMGFANTDGSLTKLLERYNGNVNYVVRALVEGKLNSLSM